MKRLHCVVPAIVLVVSASAVAQSRAYEPKSLARYDVSYGRCETTFPEMKGHRDEAYLNLWRASPNEKTNGRLADARANAVYKTERKHALQAAAKAPTEEEKKKVEQECRALWGELARKPKPAK
ncbi:MAG TPA: hypothetical protein VH041_18030 [Caldimonas sp.]|jgi:hypothetical protein|nr:hypothetical protein [Caldimonas sp.]HEX4236191.1 hypothetical protein [Caldimonas sp.]